MSVSMGGSDASVIGSGVEHTQRIQRAVDDAPTSSSRTSSPPDPDDLEQRLAALELEVRSDLAARQAEERAKAAKEDRREYVVAAAASDAAKIEVAETDAVEGPKIVIGKGIDPRHDPTLVGRRDKAGKQWTFDGPAPPEGIGQAPGSIEVRNKATDVPGDETLRAVPDDMFAKKGRPGLWVLLAVAIAGGVLAIMIFLQNRPPAAPEAPAAEPQLSR